MRVRSVPTTAGARDGAVQKWRGHPSQHLPFAQQLQHGFISVRIGIRRIGKNEVGADALRDQTFEHHIGIEREEFAAHGNLRRLARAPGMARATALDIARRQRCRAIPDCGV